LSSAAAIAPQVKSANLFELRNISGKTKITCYLSAPGPIVQGRTVGSLFRYDGPEGTWTFDASQITHEDTSLGRLISVALKPRAGGGVFTFWLFLPPVVLADNDFETFTTYGMKNRRNVQRPGTQVNYEAERFLGDAKAVMLPL